MKNKSSTMSLRLLTGMSNHYSLSVPGGHAKYTIFSTECQGQFKGEVKNVICMVS